MKKYTLLFLLLTLILAIVGCSEVSEVEEFEVDDVKNNLVKTFKNGDSSLLKDNINSNIDILDLSFNNQADKSLNKKKFISYLESDMLKEYSSFEFVDYSTAINEDTATLTGSIVANIDQEYTFYIALDLVKSEENWLITKFSFANSKEEITNYQDSKDKSVYDIISNWGEAIEEGDSYTDDIASNIKVIDIATLDSNFNQELSTAEYETYLNNHYLQREYKSFSLDDRVVEVKDNKATLTATNNFTTVNDEVLSYYTKFYLTYNEEWSIVQQEVAQSKTDLENYLNSSQITGKVNLDNVQLQLNNTDNSINQSQTTSDSFTFDNLAKGNYILSIQKENYVTKTVNITIETAKTKDLGTIELTKQDGTIAGTIPSNAIATIVETGATSTSADFEINTTEGEYTLLIEKDNKYPRVLQTQVSAGDTVNLGSISLNDVMKETGEKGETLNFTKTFTLTELNDADSDSYKQFDVWDYVQSNSNITTKDEIDTVNFDLTFKNGEDYYVFLKDIDNATIKSDGNYNTAGKEINWTLTDSEIQEFDNFKIGWPYPLGDTETKDGELEIIGEVINKDEFSPIVDLNNNFGYDYYFDLEFAVSDNGTGVDTIEYLVTNSLSEPSSNDFNSSDTNTKQLSIEGTGTYYLHIKATDKAGNTTYDKFGPYIVK